MPILRKQEVTVEDLIAALVDVNHAARPHFAGGDDRFDRAVARSDDLLDALPECEGCLRPALTVRAGLCHTCVQRVLRERVPVAGQPGIPASAGGGVSNA